ncbi:MAG: four helix bundle protein [Crocinitomicaceae bacterium]
MILKTTRKDDGPMAKKSFLFAIKVIRECKVLIQQNEFILSRQLMRSGTSVGALIRESKNAESHRDFIHKLSIAQKEADETIYWIDLLYECEYIDSNKYSELHSYAVELMKMLTSTLKSLKQKST